MDQLFTVQHAYLIPLLPLLGAVIAGFFGAKWLKSNSHLPIWIGVGCSAVLALLLLFGWKPEGEGQASVVRNFYTWIEAGNFHVNVGYFFDSLTITMLCVVCGIGFLITV